MDLDSTKMKEAEKCLDQKVKIENQKEKVNDNQNISNH